MSKRIANKVLLIGWGSADWKTINPLIEKGLMPNFSKLLETGAKASLGTIDPPIPIGNWVSALTSKAPVKHHIYTYTEPGETANFPVTSKKRKAKFLWEILSEKNLTVHQIGAPASYPVKPVNGVSVADLFFEVDKPDLSNQNLLHPQNYFEEYLSLKEIAHQKAEETLNSWQIEPMWDEQRYNQLTGIIKNFLQHSYYVHLLALHQIESDWDSFNVFYTKLTDVVFAFTRFHLNKNKTLPKALHQNFKTILTKCYQCLDDLLGELLAKVDEETTVMLFSQGGYMPYQSYINQLDKNNSTYEYNTPGILVMRGKKAFKREELFAVNSLDICSTILILLGLPFAKDMDGKVLLGHQFFTRMNEPIDTYETPEENETAVELIELPDYEKRLNALGYLTKSISEQQQYFECRSKITSGKQQEVIEFLVQQWKKYPKNSWVGGRLAGCYLATNQIEKAKAQLDKVLLLGDEIAELHLLKGNILMMEMKFRSASKEYEIAEKNIGHIPNLYSQIGEAYGKMNQHQLAQQYFEKEIKINPHPSSYTALASTFLQRKMMAKAIEPLQKAIDLAPQIPGAWFQLGNCKMQTKDYEGAAEAFEQAKKINRDPRIGQQIQNTLVVLYRDHLSKPEKLKEMREAYEKSIGSRGTITIVSGLPRSGTSMMMQMLVNGGMQAFTDGKREADENNQKGYFEHELIKSLGSNKQVLSQIGDKVVKIISHLLFHLPHIYKYKIIFMDRSIEEVMHSQHKMLGRLGKERGGDKANSMALLKTFEDSRKKAIDWCNKHPKYVELLLVPYSSVISNPLEESKKVNEFLGGQLDEIKMASVVDKSLYREKSMEIKVS